MPAVKLAYQVGGACSPSKTKLVALLVVQLAVQRIGGQQDQSGEWDQYSKEVVFERNGNMFMDLGVGMMHTVRSFLVGCGICTILHAEILTQFYSVNQKSSMTKFGTRPAEGLLPLAELPAELYSLNLCDSKQEGCESSMMLLCD